MSDAFSFPARIQPAASRPRGAWRLLVLSVGWAVALSACGGAASSTPAPTAAPPATAAPTATPAPTPAASPTIAPTAQPTPTVAAIALCGKDLTACIEAPGAYTTAPFAPPFTFTIGEGWKNDLNEADTGELSNVVGSFSWMANPRASDPTGKPLSTGIAPEDLIAALHALKGFTVSATATVTIGGLIATQVDVLSNKSSDNFIFVLQHIGVGMRPASEMRLTFLQLDQVVVVLVLETDKATDFDAFAATAQPILDSIAWP
jgi:hypothetical protein